MRGSETMGTVVANEISILNILNLLQLSDICTLV